MSFNQFEKCVRDIHLEALIVRLKITKNKKDKNLTPGPTIDSHARFLVFSLVVLLSLLYNNYAPKFCSSGECSRLMYLHKGSCKVYEREEH